MSTFFAIEKEEMPTPSSLTWKLQDISPAESGRTQDGKMHKSIVTQIRVLSVAWNNPGPGNTSKVLKAVNQKVVFNATYHDPMDNKLETRKFYVGDRTVPFKIWTVDNKRYERLEFELIER